MVDRPTMLNCKALSFNNVKDSEWTKSKMLIFLMVLIFALILTTFGISSSVESIIKSYIWNVFYVHENCKFLIFKFSKVMQQHT